MCTLTWLFNDDAQGYSLFFNRDELKTRKRALPPQMQQTKNGVSFLAPTDADAGGTWLAVNQYGLTICLLNNYASIDPDNRVFKSRGEIVVALIDSHSIASVEEKLLAMDLSFYRGFQVVIFQHEVKEFSWDDVSLTQLIPKVPVTSSSYDPEAVCHNRQQYFQSMTTPIDLNSLSAFHQSHINEDMVLIEGKPDYIDSVCMHRALSKTVSQCSVHVCADQVSIAYSDGSPCEVSVGVPIILQRRVAA
jgi:hypothetical protein